MMEELINELDMFVNEKAILSAQIRDIENKRNELAKERNTKKAQNKIKNDEEVWSEVNCLGKQISDLGNQSQWFQNQINSKLLNVREQSFVEIDNLIAESVRKSRIISEQIEEKRDNVEEPVSIKNIVVKVENNELVYKAELSNKKEIKIYPVKEKLLEKEKFERETWKRELIEYSASSYRNLRNIAIRKMDPIVCEILDRFAVQYDVDSQNLVYNYVMSFSSIDEYDSDILPAITYNLSYISEAKISKKEIRTVQKIIKNSTQNALVDIIGNVTLSEKIKCFMKKIFNISSANILPEGNKE